MSLIIFLSVNINILVGEVLSVDMFFVVDPKRIENIFNTNKRSVDNHFF